MTVLKKLIKFICSWIFAITVFSTIYIVGIFVFYLIGISIDYIFSNITFIENKYFFTMGEYFVYGMMLFILYNITEDLIFHNTKSIEK